MELKLRAQCFIKGNINRTGTEALSLTAKTGDILSFKYEVL